MSGWTIITVRGKPASDYDYTHKDYDNDRSYANYDLAATFAEDSRIRAWTTGSGHVYALLACGRYDWGFAEALFEDYDEMIDDAVVLGWNDTTDSGCARYYPRPYLGEWQSQYEDEYQKGERACAVMYAQHGIHARNPFHNQAGRRDDRYQENGNVREELVE